jgi:hypothetical protein
VVQLRPPPPFSLLRHPPVPPTALLPPAAETAPPPPRLATNPPPVPRRPLKASTGRGLTGVRRHRRPPNNPDLGAPPPPPLPALIHRPEADRPHHLGPPPLSSAIAPLSPSRAAPIRRSRRNPFRLRYRRSWRMKDSRSWAGPPPVTDKIYRIKIQITNALQWVNGAAKFPNWMTRPVAKPNRAFLLLLSYPVIIKQRF